MLITFAINFGHGVLPEINNNNFNIMYRCSYNSELVILDTIELQIVRPISFQLDSKCSDNDNVMIYFSLWDSPDNYVYLKNFEFVGKTLLDNETLFVMNTNTLYYFDYFSNSEWDFHGNNIAICNSTLNCNCIDDDCTVLPPLARISKIFNTKGYINISIQFTFYADVKDSLGAGQPTVLLVYYCGATTNTIPFGIFPRWTVITETLDASCENNDNITIEFQSLSALNIAYFDDFYVFGDLTQSPTQNPTNLPSMEPTNFPSLNPTTNPTLEPSMTPTVIPTMNSINPTISPSAFPSIEPTTSPTLSPTLEPTKLPSKTPTISPSIEPTTSPTLAPTIEPSQFPAKFPTKSPTIEPTNQPSIFPSTPTNITVNITKTNILDIASGNVSNTTTMKPFVVLSIVGTCIFIIVTILLYYFTKIYYKKNNAELPEPVILGKIETAGQSEDMLLPEPPQLMQTNNDMNSGESNVIDNDDDNNDENNDNDNYMVTAEGIDTARF